MSVNHPTIVGERSERKIKKMMMMMINNEINYARKERKARYRGC